VSDRRSLFRRHFLPSLAAFIVFTLLAGSDAAGIRKTVPERMGQVVDWSGRHIHYPQGASLRALALSERDPRAYWNYLRLSRPARVLGRPVGPGGPTGPRGPMPRPVRGHADWSVSLGAAGTAQSMYPAKFSFDVNATPDCTNDFVVFAINTAPSGTQANIAAFNNLYSGVSSTSCGTNTAATVTWAYEVSAAALPTSPIISLDGTKVAFVDGANPAVFHVLTPVAGQGTVGAPHTPAPVVNVTLGGLGATDSNSPVFMDYYKDIAYVGTDTGSVYKITPVFKGTPPAGGTLFATAGTGVLTGPVVDFNTGNIFVGSADGNLYGFTAAGTAIAGSPLAIGDGSANGGIADPPVVDVVNKLLYVASGANGTSAVVVQAGTSSFVSPAPVTAAIGRNGTVPIHAGALNNAYFNSSTNGATGTTEWFFYVCGVEAFPMKRQQLWQVPFNSSRVMSTTATAVGAPSAHNGEACSPLTELNNGVDRLFLGLLTTGVVEFFDISTSTTPTLGGAGGVAPVAEAGGTSGIIVDNVSAIAQASSIYFTTQATSANCGGKFCAVKLTQGGLQ
jgi:hypothetical protein